MPDHSADKPVSAGLPAPDDAATLLDLLLETAPVGFALVDRELRFIRINAALAAVNGRPVAEHLGRAVREVSPRLAAAIEPIVRRVLETGEPALNREVSGETPAAPGRRRHWLANYYPVRTADGRIIGVGAVASEITERKEAEEERERLVRDLRVERERLEAARREAERAVGSTTRLQAVTAALGEALTPAEVAAVIVEHAVAALGANAGSVVVPAEEGFEIAAAAGYPAEALDRWGRFPRDAPIPLADAARSGEPLFIPSREAGIARYPHLEAALRGPHQASASIPLLVEGRLLGALGLSFVEPRDFGPEARTYILALARQCAQALERARLYDAERQARAAAEAAQRRLAFLAEASATLAASLDYQTTLTRLAGLVVPRLADWCTVNLWTDDGAIARVALIHADPDKEAVLRELRRRFPPDPAGDHPLVRVLRTGQPALFTDAPEGLMATLPRDGEELALARRLATVSLMIVPLIVHDRTLGAITFGCGHPERRFGPDDLALAEDLARRAALAVDNARLYQDARAAIEARDRFLLIASHELRTPVAAIKGYAQLLLRQIERDRLNPERLARALRSIDEGTGRLERLTGDLLDVSRLRLGQLALRVEPLDLGRLVEECAAQFRGQLRHGLRLAVETPDAPCAIRGDADRLAQVVANLLENAAKYSPEGGAIRVALAPDGDGALLTVRDEGIGLAADALEAIFQPFGRAPNATERQIPGLGLGLYISRDIAERHGGRLWAESAGEGRGTTFHLRLPCDSGASAQPPPAPATPG